MASERSVVLGGEHILSEPMVTAPEDRRIDDLPWCDCDVEVKERRSRESREGFLAGEGISWREMKNEDTIS